MVNMYDLIDIQVLFESTNAMVVGKDLLEQLKLSYVQEASHFILDDYILVPLRNRLILISPSTSPQTFNVQSEDHMRKLLTILTSMQIKSGVTLNEGGNNNIQE